MIALTTLEKSTFIQKQNSELIGLSKNVKELPFIGKIDSVSKSFKKFFV